MHLPLLIASASTWTKFNHLEDSVFSFFRNVWKARKATLCTKPSFDQHLNTYSEPEWFHARLASRRLFPTASHKVDFFFIFNSRWEYYSLLSDFACPTHSCPPTPNHHQYKNPQTLASVLSKLFWRSYVFLSYFISSYNWEILTLKNSFRNE